MLSVGFPGGVLCSTYTVDLDGDILKESFVLPAKPTMKLCFRIRLGRDYLNEEQYPNLWNSLLDGLRAAPVWKCLNYTVRTTSNEDLMVVQLEDKALDAGITGSLEKPVTRLRSIMFELVIADSGLPGLYVEDQLQQVYQHLNYLMLSNLVSLQSEYPYCFSWIARTMFKASYSFFVMLAEKTFSGKPEDVTFGAKLRPDGFLEQLTEVDLAGYLKEVTSYRLSKMQKSECMFQFWMTSKDP